MVLGKKEGATCDGRWRTKSFSRHGHGSHVVSANHARHAGTLAV